MIPLQYALNDHLPVCVDDVFGDIDQAPLWPEEIGDSGIGLSLSLLGDIDQSVTFNGLHRHKTVFSLVQTGKAVFMRHATQLSIKPVCPGMIAAAQARPLSHAVRNNLGAAMAAGIEENACDPVLAPYGEQRCLRRIPGDITSWFRNGGGWTKRGRCAAHHPGEFALIAFERRVVGDRLAPDLIKQVRRVVVDVIENALDDRGVVVENVCHGC